MRYFRLLSLLAVPLLLAGCETMDSLVPSMPNLGMSDLLGSSAPAMEAARTTGLAVSDEPYAAQTGATILSQGGSAADAALKKAVAHLTSSGCSVRLARPDLEFKDWNDQLQAELAG